MTRYSTTSIVLIIALISLSSAAFAPATPPSTSVHTVTMNLRFHITDINDIIHVNGTSYSGQRGSLVFTNLTKPYISAERDGTVLAFISSDIIQAAGSTELDPYLFQITQNSDQQYMIVLTNGTWQTVDNTHGQIPATTFGNLPAASVTNGLALQLQLTTMDLTGLLGPGQMLIKSLGFLQMPKISIEVIG